MSGCGKSGTAKPANPGNTVAQGFRIGLALPETQTTRYETVDHPVIEAKLKELCPKCQVDYENAGQNASTQAQQIDTLITKGDKVIILDAVDYQAIQPEVAKAHSAGVKIVSYDRLALGPVDAYTSFNNAGVGKQQAEGLLQAMGSKATPSSRIIMLNGDKGDANAAQFKAGAHQVLNGKVKIAAEFDTKNWLPATAADEVATALSRFGRSGIAGIYAANDGMASGAVSALQAAHVDPLPPITGQDAQLDAVQRIVAGTQTFTIYKPYSVEASTAAQMAIEVATGATLEVANTKVDSATDKGIPARLVDTTILDDKNIRQTVIGDGIYTVAQICTAQYATACARIGLK